MKNFKDLKDFKYLKGLSGIYHIVNKVNGKYYIGSSNDIYKRRLAHITALRRNKHHNIHLQRAFNKQKESDFEFIVIELCDNLKEREQCILNELDLTKCYNVSLSSSGGDLISNHPNRDDIIRRTTETINNFIASLSPSQLKDKFSYPLDKNPNWRGGSSKHYCDCGNEIGYSAKCCSKCRDRTGKNNPFYNKKHSNRTKKIISKTHKGRKPANIKPIEINGIKYTSAYEASEKLNISQMTIRWRVKSKNKRFKKYKYLKTNKKTNKN